MKTLRHLSLLIIFCCAFSSSKAQYVTIPDTAFVSYLLTNFPSAMNGNTMDTTDLDVITATKIVCSFSNIHDLTGVQYFDNLDQLYCDGNFLTTLPPLPIYLTTLECQNNLLTSLSNLPSNLFILNCNGNQISSFVNVPTYLYMLDCSYNLFTVLPQLPTDLGFLNCGGNRLDSLPPIPNVINLNCQYNLLSSLPPLSNKMVYLVCNGNLFTSLPQLPDSLTHLYCANNPNLRCLPRLKKLTYLEFDSLKIACIPNYAPVTTSSPILSNIPLCDPFSPNGCKGYWNIKGYAFNDLNGNCVQQSGDNNLSLLKVNLYKNGTALQQTYTNPYGHYSFDTDTGNFDITIDTTNVPFDIKCPVSRFKSASVSLLDSLKTGLNFSMQCKAGFDVGIQSIAVVTQFRPGAVVPVIFKAGDLARIYGSPCNTTNLSGQLVITISGPAQYAGSAAGALTPVVNGNTLTYNVANWATVAAGAFNFKTTTDTTAQAGQQVCFNASVTPAAGDNNTTNNTFTQCFTVVNSYDPNDKRVSPADNINNSSQWLTYTIRFQNTGNAPAIHIYIIDTLDAVLDINSFEILAYSHQPVVNIYNDKRYVRFTFPNINLADSVNNEPESHGYIQYRVKTIAGLNCGTQIGNAAQIYFDFNPPITTNAAVNRIYMSSVTNLQNTICNGEQFNFNGQALSAPGSYTDTLQATFTCDSIITLQLQVLPAIAQNQSGTTCAGEPFNFNGRALTAAGVYTDTLQASSTCDSIVTLQLQVLPAITQNQSGTTCAGEPFNFNGRALTAAGVYTDTLQAASSCDSIITLQLQVLPAIEQNESATVCNGEAYNWHNRTLTAAGNYTDTLQASSTCDSIITLQLQVLQGAEVSESASICDGETYNWRNRSLTARDTYTDTLQTAAGCDSVLILNLEVYTGYSAVVDTAILAGTGLVLPSGTTVTAPGNYTDTLQSIFGCDSIIITRLSVISGIENLAGTAAMQLYPNPANDMVTINLSDNLTGGTLTLSDVTGRSLNTIAITSNHNQLPHPVVSPSAGDIPLHLVEKERNKYILYTGALSSGVYLVTAVKGGVRVVQRLVVSQ